MNIVSYGGGTDSTAMIIECFNRGVKIDYILFADTGAEKTHTYEYVKNFSKWCVGHGFPKIITVKKAGNGETLEQECIRTKSLPSIAYGYKKCSQKFKIQPQDMFFNNCTEVKEIWKQGGKVNKFIGYDTTESSRAEKINIRERAEPNKKYNYVYPLIEWGIPRKQCLEIIKDAGLCLPGKSACYFCPSSKVSEIKQLKHTYPLLFDRAIALEDNANLTKIKGLGREFSWRDAVLSDDMFEDEFDLMPEMICECFEP
jgi:hypothetical protein